MTNQNLVKYEISNIENKRLHGRTAKQQKPLTLFWTGSALELNVSGSELWVEVEAGFDSLEPWISILINSFPVIRQPLQRGRQWVQVFKGMSPAAVKNIRIVRDSQAMNGDPACYLKLLTLSFDGEFLPVEERPYKLEFIGDSITSGEGAIGAKEEEDWIPMWFSAINNYTWLTAKALNADYRVISQSGWGILTSWDNNPHCNIPEYYSQVCGILTGESNEALGAFEENDFLAWQPDIIVLNLGTNDRSAFYNAAFSDEVSGEYHKQRLNEDGSFNEEDLMKFKLAAISFLKQLRSFNTNSHIIWAYGMLGNTMLPAIEEAVDNYKNETGDSSVSVLQLPDMTEETVGSKMHPGLLSHERAAKLLADYIKTIKEA